MKISVFAFKVRAFLITWSWERFCACPLCLSFEVLFIELWNIASRDILGRFLFIFKLVKEIVLIFRRFWDFCIRWYLRRLSLPGFSEMKCFELTSAKSFEVFLSKTRSFRAVIKLASGHDRDAWSAVFEGKLPRCFRARLGLIFQVLSPRRSEVGSGITLWDCPKRSRYRLGMGSWRELRGVLVRFGIIHLWLPRRYGRHAILGQIRPQQRIRENVETNLWTQLAYQEFNSDDVRNAL